MANIDGELKRAQFEQVTELPAAPQPTGRVVELISDTANTKTYKFNGTDWVELQTASTDTQVVTQNSGKSCTVNWATGLVQRVILTDNALISFSNPQEGKTHRLIVSQNSTPVGSLNGNVYAYAFNMSDQDCGDKPFQPEGILSFSQSRQFSWLYKTAARPGYATVPSTSWTIGATGAVAHYVSSFDPEGLMLGTGRGTSIFHDYLKVIGGNFNYKSPMAGILNSPVAPLTAQGTVVGLKWHPSGNHVFTAITPSPYVEVYATMDRRVPVGNRFADPATLPAGAPTSIDVHPTGNYIVVGHATTPFFSAYSFNGGQPVKLSNPATLLTTLPGYVTFNPLGGFLATNNATSPYLKTYVFTDSVGTGSFGSQVADPSTLPGGGNAGAGLRYMAWRPQGDYIAMGIGNVAPYLYVVPFNRSTATYGTPVTIANGLIGQQIRAVNWSPCGQYLIVGTTTAGTSSVYVFDFSAGTIGTPVVWDSTMPTAEVNDIVIHPSGDYFLVIFNASPWTVAYQIPRKVKNYVRL